MPFRVVNEKIIVKARVNRGPLMDFVLDTGSEQTVISRETAARMGIRPIVNILSAGVGDLGVRELELTRLDELEIGIAQGAERAVDHQEPAAARPADARDGKLLAAGAGHVGDHRLRPAGAASWARSCRPRRPTSSCRCACIGSRWCRGRCRADAASFILDTGGQVISISTDTASGLERGEMRQHPAEGVRRVGMGSRRVPDARRQPELHDKIEYKNLSVVVLNLRAPSVLLGFRLGGIVGHKFLSRYRVAINLDKSIVQLQERAQPKRAN